MRSPIIELDESQSTDSVLRNFDSTKSVDLAFLGTPSMNFQWKVILSSSVRGFTKNGLLRIRSVNGIHDY